MPATKTRIANLAISHLAVAKRISEIDTEDSPEANIINTFYDQALEELLREFPWPFATKFQVLNLIETAPTVEWGFSYRYPSTCLDARRILSGTRNDTRQSKIVMKFGLDAQGRLIFTDKAEACLEFTDTITDTAVFHPDFVFALSYRLAFYIAPTITEGDPFSLQQKAFQLSLDRIQQAAAKAFNEQEDDEQRESEFIRDRMPGPGDDRSFRGPINPFT